MMLQQFWKAGLKLKSSNCYFFETWVTFLGHALTPEGMLPDQDNVQKLTDWPVPACFTDVQVILGMGNYYRWFIQNFLKKMQPLIELTRKTKPFEWTEECQNVFDLLKEA